ncbi:uncharacterized protein LOC107637270 isoform X2 [Arachis ipaensis]|uniref:Uncharacterized protein n=1 Tax=Arachis hypogaea TaxID=3818 RepID=A0A445AXM3_ARAHY|nr:uncharacterized protein LOC107637270 isoform X2 [Arachis ipaensis]XP_025629908.1 uncharacterized protein LOC112722930 isoform X2 [Arachis hypogaea]QHO21190.1 uncharacterized protein DS421_11g344530 [Arachis hypogaea]RYR31126.1 hypothetical protein Ahy_B01g055915 [Arachis hypogaea]
MNSFGGTHTPAIPRRRKHENSLFGRWSCNIHHAKANASPVTFRHRSPKPDLSARKLAAALWHFCFLEVSGLDCKEDNWGLRKSNKVAAKIVEERKATSDSVVSALLSEMLRAQSCIDNLKAENKSSKKKLQQLAGELEEKLGRERRSRERMEKMNARLVHELAKANLCVNQIRIRYDEERKQRELIEQVCNELAMQIGEDKAKVERLQSDFMKIQEEFEQERSMFEMADLWRQESIQMKLADARISLEDKHNQMLKLVDYLNSFLRSKGVEKADEEFRRGLVNEPVIKVDSPPNLNALFSSTIHIVSLDNEDQQQLLLR